LRASERIRSESGKPRKHPRAPPAFTQTRVAIPVPPPPLVHTNESGQTRVAKQKWCSHITMHGRTHSKINEGLPYAGLHPKFPKLEFPIHTGFDQETGFFNYKHLLTFNSEEQHQRMQTVVNPKGGLMYKEVPRDSMLIKEAFKHEYVKQAVPKGAANPHNIPHVYISTDDDAKWIEEQTVHTPKEGDALFFEYDGSGKRGKTMTHKDVETSERWTVVSSILNKKYIEP